MSFHVIPCHSRIFQNQKLMISNYVYCLARCHKHKGLPGGLPGKTSLKAFWDSIRLKWFGQFGHFGLLDDFRTFGPELWFFVHFLNLLFIFGPLRAFCIAKAESGCQTFMSPSREGRLRLESSSEFLPEVFSDFSPFFDRDMSRICRYLRYCMIL